MATDRIIRWRFLLEEYGATFEHVPGTKNIVADALSRLDADFETVMEPHLTKSEMAHLFLIQGETKETDFPLSPALIAKYQRKHKTLKNKIQQGLSNNYNK